MYRGPIELYMVPLTEEGIPDYDSPYCVEMNEISCSFLADDNMQNINVYVHNDYNFFYSEHNKFTMTVTASEALQIAEDYISIGFEPVDISQVKPIEEIPNKERDNDTMILRDFIHKYII